MLELSEAAIKDIEDILDRSVIDCGVPQTERYYDALNHCLALLDENPDMGTTADDIREGYLRFPHQSHMIFYQVQSTGIRVIRVLHQRMDVKHQLNE